MKGEECMGEKVKENKRGNEKIQVDRNWGGWSSVVGIGVSSWDGRVPELQERGRGGLREPEWFVGGEMPIYGAGWGTVRRNTPSRSSRTPDGSTA